MAKNRIEVQLGFSADTANAQRQIEQLGKTLNSITSGQALNISEGWTKELSEGVTAANKLKVALSNAVNVNTGKLDLGKFQQTLKQSGMSLANYREQLASLGTVGQDAFMQLTRSIINAEAPVFRVSNALKKMGTTLMNTMRWQLSASLIQGFTGAIQDAVDYAQDLNESLNDIRIVTGYNVDKMDEFAIKANKAAKALSTTTNEYAKASLIYFQQGLNDKQVEERANTTVKLANVTGESAETVSEWMTAVWNNFDNGSKSLEYYADVMTALGAATASSSDEIAQGLEKFAAISNTIGLSYEYAASALATVTSQTRQSADIVGTAFKTIFGRMEGLTLGETLDDGTNLNKYSESLKTVGVDILNANNELKSMDIILNELGQRWGTLSQAQKVALAQTVGGMRQYNQLIALMDNWDYFQQNLEMSLSSSGTLEEQANIYAESWEAARDRVTAAAETLYDKLLNDEGFIKILGFFEDFLGLVDKAVDSMGGLQGVIALAGTALMTMLSPQITKGLETLGLNLMMLTSNGREKVNSLKTQALEDLVGGDGSTDSKLPNDLVSGSQARHDVAGKIGTLEKYYNENQSTMTDHDQQLYRAEIDGVDSLSKKYMELADQHDILINRKKRLAAGGQDLTKVEEELANVEADLSDVQETLGKRVGEVANNMHNATPRTLSWAEGLTMAAQAASQLAFFFTSVGSLVKSWDGVLKGTVSVGDALTSTLMSLGFMLPTAISLLKSLNNKTLAATFIQAAYVQQKKNAAKATGANAGALQIESKELKENTANVLANKKAWLVNLGGIAKIILPIAVAVGAVVAAFALINHQLNKHNKEAEKARKVADNLKESFESAKESYDNLISTMSSYEDGVKGLEELTRGTEEFEKAIRSSNEQALELINTYDELQGKWSVNDDGLIVLDESVLKDLEQNQLREQLALQNTYLTANQNAKYKEQTAQEKELLKDINTVTSGGAGWGTGIGLTALGAGGLAAGMALTALLGPIGLIAGTIVALGSAAAGIYAITEGMATKKEQSALDTLQNAYNELAKTNSQAQLNTEEKFTEVLKEFPELIDEFEKNRESIYKLLESNYNLIKSNEELYRLQSRNVNAGKEWYDNSLYKNELDAYAAWKASKELPLPKEKVYIGKVPDEYGIERETWAENITEGDKTKSGATFIYLNEEDYYAHKLGLLDTSQDKIIDNTGNTAFFAGDALKFKEVAQTYIEKVLKDTQNYRAKNNKIQKRNEEGKWEDFDSGLDTLGLLKAIYRENQLNLTEEDNKKIQSEADKLQNKGIDPSIISQIYSVNGVTDLSAYNESEINQIYNQFQQELKTDFLQAGQKNRNIEIRELNNQIKNKGLESFWRGLSKSEYSVDSLNSLLTASIKSSKLDNLIGFSELINSIQDSAVQSEIASLIESQDFSSPFALEQFQKRLEDAKITLDETTQTALKNYIEGMQEAEKATLVSTSGLKGLTNALATAEKALEKVKIGDVISEDVYNSLIEINPALEEFFLKTGEGFVALEDGSVLFANNVKSNIVDTLDDLPTIAKQVNTEVEKVVANERWNKEKNEFNLNSFLVDGEYDVAAMKEYLEKLKRFGPNLLAAAGISNLDALGTDEAAIIATFKSIQTIVQESVAGTLSEATFVGQFIYQEVESIKELEEKLKEVFGANSVEANTLYVKYKDLVKQREILNRELQLEYVILSKINRAIETYNRLLNENSEKADRAYGINKVNLLQQQITLYKKLADEQETLANTFSEELRNKRNDIKNSNFADNITFNPFTGEILETNLDNLTDSQKEDLNKLVNDYNSILDNFYQATEDAAQATRDALDTKLERLQYVVDIDIKLYDEDLEKLEKEFDRLDDKAFSAAEKINNIASQLRILDDKKEVYLNNQTNILKQYGASSWKELMAIEGINQEEIISQLEKDVEALEEIEQTLYDMDKLMADTLLNSFKEFGEAFDKINEKASGLKAIVDSYKNIVSLTRQFTNIDSELIKKMNETSVAIAQNQMETSKAKYDSLKQERDNALAMFNEAIANNDMGTADYWKKQLEEINSMVDKAQQDFMSSWENALQVAADAYKNTIEETIRDFEKSQTGLFGSYDSMLEYYDQQTKLQDLYLKDYERIYELSKLNRKVMKDIDETDSVAAKKELRKLQAEINELQNSNTEMSQYDLEYLQKKYDLRVAEIALEEAQRAKNQVQLVRNAAGGWGYVYTADQNNIEDAEQKYEDKLFELQDYSMNYMDQIGREVVALQQEYIQKIQEVYNSGLSGEQLQAALDNVNKYYGAQLEATSKEYDKTVKNHNELVKNIAATASDTGALMVAGEDFVKKFEDTIVAKLGYGTVDGETGSLGSMYKNIREFVNSVISESDDGLLTKLQSGYQKFQAQCNEILRQAGTDFNTLGSTINSAIGTDSIGIIGKLSELDSATQELQNNMSSHMANILEEAESWGSNMSNIYWDVVDAANAAAEALAEARKAAAADLPEIPEIPKQNENKEKDKNDNTTTQDDLIEKTKKEIANGMWDMDANRTPSNPDSPEEAIEDNDNTSTGFWNNLLENQSSVIGTLVGSVAAAYGTKQSEEDKEEPKIEADTVIITPPGNLGFLSRLAQNATIAQFDTGGYTGSWGPSARLALLDEKELVLDKYDTANFLTALGVLDSILETINLNAISSSLGSPNVRSTNVNNMSNNLEQEVIIHAEFPNATDHNEIQEAFNNLINTASQYANRK